MKVGYNWLREYIAFDWAPQELAERLTAIGTAVDGITPVFEPFTMVTIGRIEQCDVHPRRPDLRVLIVDLKAGKKQMVSGAPNCRAGLVVAAALPGAELPGLKGETLGVREIDGVRSEGMCCSEKELGLSDDGSVLMELDPEEYTVGANLWDALELDDVSISFDLTPNRSDCLSVIGIAREIAALSGGRIRRPEIKLQEAIQGAAEVLRVEIEDTAGCPRYAGRLVKGGMVKSSPFWLKRCIRSAGMRPINNAVDITNFVMLETGQPLHAFDWSKFPDGRVLVRAATPGETFVTLDGNKRNLPTGAVMITNGKDAVAIGGVMGGAESEVTPETTDFLIESAHFAPAAIRRTRTRLGMATESALRFEKGVDPNGVRNALDRAADLFAKLTGGSVLAGAVDAYPTPIEPVRLDLDPERVNRILGMSLSTPSMIDILGNLEFGVVPGKTASITVPTFRPDVTREIDLVEEIARIHGYEKIPVNRRSAGLQPTPREPRHHAFNRCRDILEGLGYTEIVTNSLVDPTMTSVDAKSHVTIRNPLSAELSILRPDLITGALTVIAHNMNRQADSVAIYEVGRIFQWRETDHSFDEHTELVMALSGQAPVPGWDSPARPYDFFDLKGAVLELAATWDPNAAISPVAVPPYIASDSFELLAGGKRIGTLGLIDSALADRFDIRTPVWLARLELDLLVMAERPIRQYKALAKFPAAFRDIAVVVDKSLAVGAVESTIRQAGGPLLESVRLFDRYAGKPIPEGKISVAFSISYRHPDRTLTDDEVESAQRAIVAALESAHGATLRQ